MLSFNEAFAWGFFGFRRTYGAIARFEYDSPEALETDWSEALRKTGEWRASRNHRATALHFHFVGPSALAWNAISFVAARILVAPLKLAPELRGLNLEVAVFGTPGMEQYLELVLARDATEISTEGKA